jgi:PAS domain S-box-containing protein
MLGDQMAAVIGQGCVKVGMVKVTFGTGCFCVMNCGKDYTPPASGLFSPILYGDKANHTYGLEGYFEIDGERMQASALERIAYQTAYIIKTMEKSTGQSINVLRVDGGMAKNDYLVQVVADILGIPVERPAVTEASIIGAIFQAGITIGFWNSFEETASLWKLEKRFEPKVSDQDRVRLYPGMTDNIDVRIVEGIKLANIGFYSYTFDGTVLAMDRVTFDFFDLGGIYNDPQSVVGKSIESLFIYTGPKGRVRHNIREKGSVSNLEYGIRTLKNSEKWGIHNSYAYFDKEAGEEAIQVCFYEITERKMYEKERIEQSEERYKNLFEHSPDSIMIMDPNGKILECNNATVELLGLNFEKLIGQRFENLEILDRAQAKRYMDMLKPLANGENVNAAELELIMKKGDSKWIEMFPNLLMIHGKSQGIQIISRDITDRKQVDIEIRKKLMKYELDPGYIYLSKEPKPKQSIDAFNELLMVGHSGTVISRRSRGDYQNSVEYNFNHLQLSEMGQGNHVLPKYNAIHDIFTGLPRGEVVHIDCIEYLTSRIGPKKTLNLIQYLKDLAASKNLHVLISVDPVAMSNLDMGLIEKESKNVLPSKSLTGLSTKLIDTLNYIEKLNREGTMPSYSEIGEQFQLSKPTTRTRVKQLQELGIIEEIQKGRNKLLRVTEKGKSYMV